MNAAPTNVLLLLLGAVLASGADAAEQSFSGLTMGTSYRVRYVPQSDAPAPAEIQRRCAALLETFESLLSNWRAESEVSRFNAAATTNWIPVSPMFAGMVTDAEIVSRWTDGAFDITAAPLVKLWGFGPDRAVKSPSDGEQFEALPARTGHDHLDVSLDPPRLRKSTLPLAIDPGGIGKGFAADHLAGLLERHGITNYLVAIAGDQLARGVTGRFRPWRVGIEHSRDGSPALAAIIEPGDNAISTSGVYRNRRQSGGISHSHIVDPRSGRPATNTALSVTVVHPRAAIADALATGLMVLGPEEGMERATRHGWVCLFQISDGDSIRIVATESMRGLLR